MKTGRIEWIDTTKALGIVLVVLGHLPIPSPLSLWIFSFHVPLFFFLGGFLLPSPRAETTLLHFLVHRSKALLVPYLLFSIVNYIFWFLVGRKFGDDATLVLDPMVPFLGIFYAVGSGNWLRHCIALWFLPTMFIQQLLYYFLRAHLFRYWLTATVILLSCSGFLYIHYFHFRLPWGTDIALLSLPFVFAGQYAHRIRWDNIAQPWRLLGIVLSLSLSLITAMKNGHVDLAQGNTGTSIILFFLGSISGILFIILIANTLPLLRYTNLIGRNTLPILGFHLIGLSFLKGFHVYVLREPLQSLSGNIGWNLLYTLILVSVIAWIANSVRAFGKAHSLSR